jgi:tetratricopeptide (TPR) repeat protein
MMKHALLVVVAVVLSACSTQPAEAPAAQPAASSKKEISVTSKSPEAVAHFEKGRVLFDNLRVDEAAAEFAQALKLDPGFALARAFHGMSTPGSEGLKELEAAAAAAGGLPEPERVLIEGLAAGRRGELEKARTSLVRLTELAPDDWGAHYSLGQQLLVNRRYDEAVTALKKATSLNPNAGGAQNMLGYAALRQGDADGAISAFEQYVRILPQEPNPQDSLGEALLAAGRFKEAEAAFQKALQLSPQFWNAHQGIAYARFYSGDWAGGREALAKAKSGATRATDRITLDDELAAAALAQRDSRTALKILDAVEKTSGAAPADVAFVPVRRALVLTDAGRAREALAPIAAALKMAESGELPPGAARGLRRNALLARIGVEAQTRDVAAATKTSAALDEAAAAAPGDPFAATAMHYGRGMLAVAKQDPAGARTHFDQCSTEDEMCKWQSVKVAEKAGDKATAEAARAKLLKNYARDPLHLVVRSRLTAPATN